MDSTALLAAALPQIRQDEGCRLTAYLDTRGVATIGWGRADDGVALGMTCTQDQADAWLRAHVIGLIADLDHDIGWWRGLSLARQMVLLSMAYQMGVEGLMGFQHMLAAVRANQWATAADAMLDSAWAQQTPARARRLALQIKSGAVR